MFVGIFAKSSEQCSNIVTVDRQDKPIRSISTFSVISMLYLVTMPEGFYWLLNLSAVA
jgi:hypothetical protein